jgi:hypothetical protein
LAWAGSHLNMQDKKLISERLAELHVKCRLIHILCDPVCQRNSTIHEAYQQLVSLNVNFFGIIQHCIGTVVEVRLQ